MSNRRTDLRRGAIDLTTIVADQSLIDENGKLSLPTGNISQDLLTFLNHLFVELVNSDNDDINNILNDMKLNNIKKEKRNVSINDKNIYCLELNNLKKNKTLLKKINNLLKEDFENLDYDMITE